MRFVLPAGTDPLAVRLALAACLDAARLERHRDGVTIHVSEGDATRARHAWSRAGLEARPAAPWPEAVDDGGGVVALESLRSCVGRASLQPDRPGQGVLVLRLAPVSRDDALRAIARSLAAATRLRLRRDALPPLARAAARIAGGDDGVVGARAYLVVGGATRENALRGFRDAARPMRPAPARLRAGALGAWQDIGAPSGGVWRALQALEGWWT